jgi:peroxiredoxin (alkyl hydroperoxide reductase subunit C)
VANTTKTLKVGDSAPDFELPTKNQKPIRLSDYVGTHNVLLLFYPLAWTPV